MTSLAVKRLYSDDDAVRFEAIHKSLAGCVSIRDMLAKLEHANDLADVRTHWTFRLLVGVLETPAYSSWLRDYRTLMRTQAEIAALALLADPPAGMSDQARVNMSIAVTSGRTERQSREGKLADRTLGRPGKTESEEDGNSADLFGVNAGAPDVE